ncbi:hypothetical protein CR152_18935 [Massilia violaceinigra]|uniref:Uncharacterized protein n=1 Tax=Massilia violaceinigra TaxID=2045208 RepID=A0A2D2DN25_9BURK|nr:hypothetical protein [Massilia violaceinigra]ATQ76370.1 hypothetical protein CR152_18935 [Massilia violaceinigra]
MHADVRVEHTHIQVDLLEIHKRLTERNRTDFMSDILRIHDAEVRVAENGHEQPIFRQAQREV